MLPMSCPTINSVLPGGGINLLLFGVGVGLGAGAIMVEFSDSSRYTLVLSLPSHPDTERVKSEHKMGSVDFIDLHHLPQ
jgi:hypothetical protein